mmetsp:Transcript_10442/g.29367  ORF Transcript_10442/g.29367 Transcript_10442/m.29367 type:complete len:355 (-) Transcript_10442:43-1107(-)
MSAAAASLLFARVARRVSFTLSVIGVVLTAILPAIEFSVEQHRLHRHQTTVEEVIGLYGGLVSEAISGKSLSTAGIPRALVFTYKHNILETKEPVLLYNNVMDTIKAYQQLWNDDDGGDRAAEAAPIRFLDDAACRKAIAQSEPRLVSHFDSEREGKFRADICRIADLMNHGGYYFDCDLKVIQPIRLDPTIAFSSVLSGYPNLDQFFQAFLAATPGHPVLAEALQIMLDYYEGKHAIRGKNVGTSTLKDAYDAVEENKRGPSKLLIETKNDYPAIDVPKLDGVGCCCDQICHDPEERVAYFYARVPGSGKYCQLNPAMTNKVQGGNNSKGAAQVGRAGSLLGRKDIKIHAKVK